MQKVKTIATDSNPGSLWKLLIIIGFYTIVNRNLGLHLHFRGIPFDDNYL
jgi:hypothetical protein